MNQRITYGRYPTLREVLEYYSRDDFLEFLHKTLSVRRICLVIPEHRHWEPNWKEARVPRLEPVDLCTWIRERIGSQVADADPGERLPFYPSFHQSVERRPDPDAENGPLGLDGVMESDLFAWREAFHDVFTAMAVMREEDIPFHSKFSGSRSLHVMVPYATGTLKAASFGQSNAHGVAILRMPYSLNEDSGLVSLPLRWDELPTFRPWQANMHAVTSMHDDWLSEPTQEERERIAAFVGGLKQRDPEPRRAYFNFTDSRGAVRDLAGSLPAAAPDATDPQAQAWQMLRDAEPVDDARLLALLNAEDREAAWLTAEAYLLHVPQLTLAVLSQLMEQCDPYLRSAVIDLLAAFRDESVSFFLAEMQAEDMGTQARYLWFLSQDDELRERLLERAAVSTGQRGALVHRLACVTGVAARNWPAAWRMVEDAAPDHAGEPMWEKRVEALRLMEDIGQHWSVGKLTPRAMGLARLGRDITDLLLLGWGTSEKRWKRAFLAALSELGDERAMDLFVQALGDPYQDCVRWATRALLKLGRRSIPVLEEAAASDQERVRRYAFRCLGHFEDPGLREVFFAGLEDSDERVRGQAVAALGRIPDPANIPALVAVADVRLPPGRELEVVNALLAHGDAGVQAVTALALQKGHLAAAAALWGRGDLRGREMVLAALRDSERAAGAALLLADCPLDDSLVGDLAAQVHAIAKWQCGYIVRALSKLGTPAALDAVISVARDPDHVRRRPAVKALGQWDHPKAIDALVDSIEDPHRKVRASVMQALLNHGEAARLALETAVQSHASSKTRNSAQSALDALDLLKALSNDTPISTGMIERITTSPTVVWEMAYSAMESRGSEGDIDCLLELLHDSRTAVRFCAHKLLIAIGEPVRGAVARVFEEDSDPEARKLGGWVVRTLGPAEGTGISNTE